MAYSAVAGQTRYLKTQCSQKVRSFNKYLLSTCLTSHCPGAEDIGINKIKICVMWRIGNEQDQKLAPGRGRRSFYFKSECFQWILPVPSFIYFCYLPLPYPCPGTRVSQSIFFHRNFNNKGILISSISCTINLAAITSTSTYSFDHFHSLIAMIKHKSTQSK